MFSVLTEKLRSDVETIKRARATHDHVRSLIYGQDGAALPGAAGELSANAPPLLAWRIYDHCAAFTRLYAVYEKFVLEVLAGWLKMLPELYVKYGDLPDPVRTAHRIGVAEVLTRLSGERYEHLSEEGVLRGLYEGLQGVSPYRLLSEAFLREDRNFRRGAIDNLLKGVGIPNAWGWIAAHGDIQRFIQEVRGNASTADAELTSFVQYRNVAAHGDAEDVVATPEFGHVADFVVVLGDVLAQLVMREAVHRRIGLGHLMEAGVVIRDFEGRVAGVRMNACRLSVGETVVILREQACYSATVESLERDHQPFENFDAQNGDNLGMRLTRAARTDSRVFCWRLPRVELSQLELALAEGESEVALESPEVSDSEETAQ